jgi:hypothetical protein
MASGRRGGPPDFKGTLGLLLRTTLDQVGAVKDAVEKQARSQKGRFDQALDDRRRRDALAELGEEIYRLAGRQELGDLALNPTIAMHLERIDALDELDPDLDAFDHGEEAVSSAGYRPPERKSGGEYRVWRPVMPEDEPAAAAEPAPPEPSSAPKAATNTHRPRRVASRQGGAIHFVEQAPPPEDPESDEDLSEYMHEDDVPSDS